MTLAPAPPAPVVFPPRQRVRYHRFDPARVVGRMTEDDYFVFESTSTEKHEYYEGLVVAMPGSSPEHNQINANTIFGFGVALYSVEADCRMYTADQQVSVSGKKYVYPDMTIVCGTPQFDQRDRLQNPLLVVEILSPSTEANDRNDKFLDYQGIESLRHYLLIEQFRPAVTHYAKQDNGLWAIVGNYRSLSDAVSVVIDGKTATVPLSTIYRQVVFPEPDEDAPGG